MAPKASQWTPFKKYCCPNTRTILKRKTLYIKYKPCDHWHELYHGKIRNMTGDLITWAEIDLKALANNVRAYQQFIGKNVEIIAVVKANAYGHGLVPSSLTMLQAGAKRLAVHRYYEGITLRKNGIQAPILIMGDSPIEAIPDIIQWQLTLQ
jgi:predicted amino acid racemase